MFLPLSPRLFRAVPDLPISSRLSRTSPNTGYIFLPVSYRLSRPSPNTGKSLSLCYPDCHELYQTGRRTSGVYYIQPNAAPYQLPVYCLMMNGTGHTVIQRRLDGLLNFNRYRQLPVWKLMAVCMVWVWTVYGVCQDKDVHVSHCVTIGERRECKDHVSVLLHL